MLFRSPERLDWRPATPASLGAGVELLPLGRLLGHLLDCLAGFCATLYAAHPDRLAHFQRLREQPVNHSCDAAEAGDRCREYLAHIEEGLALLSDADLARRVATVFVPQGEALLTLLLGNLEHFINHKYQFFSYLKLLGVPVTTKDLYVLRGE